MEGFRPLAPGEPLGIVALSGPVVPSELERGLDTLSAWGHPVLLAANLGSRRGYLAGSDDERLAGLDRVLDRGARVIVAARGGFGATRILDRLPWERLHAQQVCLVGYSDLTAVINPLARRSGVVQVHGPMVASGLHPRRNAARLRRLLCGGLVGRRLFRFGPGKVLRHGHVTGLSVGGNLSVLTSLIGTHHEPELAGRVLFVEEVNEPMYRLDRMLTQLASSARLTDVKALIIGTLRGCSGSGDSLTGWSRRLLEVAPKDAAVVAGLPFGHGARNMAFPVGVPVEVDTGAGVIRWSR
jgi:muramoyltetrapeptide carboxypeptidase